MSWNGDFGLFFCLFSQLLKGCAPKIGAKVPTIKAKGVDTCLMGLPLKGTVITGNCYILLLF